MKRRTNLKNSEGEWKEKEQKQENANHRTSVNIKVWKGQSRTRKGEGRGMWKKVDTNLCGKTILKRTLKPHDGGKLN